MFEKFIEVDVRKSRKHLPVTEESVTKKLRAMLPPNLIDGATILDLGCATGSAGHWATINGCKSYTGVELQDNYYQTAKSLLPNAEIIQADVLEFLRTTDRQWEVVIAAGILHGIFDPFEVLRLLTKVSSDLIVIENNETHETVPSIQFRNTNMVNDVDADNPYHGTATYVGSKALEFIMNEYGWIGWRVFPIKINEGVDPYHTKQKFHPEIPEHVHRYVYMFAKKDTKRQSLESLIRISNVEV